MTLSRLRPRPRSPRPARPHRASATRLAVCLLVLVGCGALGASEELGDSKPEVPSYEGYELVWSDEFDIDGPPDPKSWDYERGFVRNEELQWYQPDNVRCEGGLLVIEGRRERVPNPGYSSGSRDWRRAREHAEYTSSSIRTKGRHAWTYGRFEMRGRIDIRPGLWPAFWALGTRRHWPACGEIDIMEYFRGTLLANACWSSGVRGKPIWDDSKTPITELGGEAWAKEFHVWRMDWDAEAIELSVDGRVLNRIELSKTINRDAEGANPFRDPQFLILNLAIGGKAGGDPSPTEFPARFEVDWVRVYQRPETTRATVGLDEGPANPRASPEARAVLAYLRSIHGKGTLAAHHVVYGDKKDQELAFVRETTGKEPALIELEGGIFLSKSSADYLATQDDLVADAIAWWREGGLVAICWHWGTPAEDRNTYPNTKVAFDIAAALREGTPEHEQLVRDLDLTAGLLSKLRDAKVPVLWRPLHEMCGGWFWWSQQGRDTAKDLWRFIYRRYTEHHGLDNLLWVYSASQKMLTDWYPGADTVDVVGVDIYLDGKQAARESFDAMASVAGTKPIALSECDLLPDPDLTAERGFAWSWATTWHSRWIRRNDADTLRRFYGHERVITRDELPRLGAPPPSE